MIDEPNMNEDLHWLAFRYVCGEMTPGEEESFEHRLAADQAAREAVAEAVELQGAIRVVAADRVRRRSWFRRRPVWIATAACLLLGFGLLWLAANHGKTPDNTPEHPPQPNFTQNDASPGKLAMTWAEIQRQADEEDVAARTPELPFVAEAGLPGEEVLENEARVPAWMVLAFSAEAKPIEGKD